MTSVQTFEVLTQHLNDQVVEKPAEDVSKKVKRIKAKTSAEEDPADTTATR